LIWFEKLFAQSFSPLSLAGKYEFAITKPLYKEKTIHDTAPAPAEGKPPSHNRTRKDPRRSQHTLSLHRKKSRGQIKNPKQNRFALASLEETKLPDKTHDPADPLPTAVRTQYRTRRRPA
jgi:hypothetical protein